MPQECPECEFEGAAKFAPRSVDEEYECPWCELYFNDGRQGGE